MSTLAVNFAIRSVATNEDLEVDLILGGEHGSFDEQLSSGNYIVTASVDVLAGSLCALLQWRCSPRQHEERLFRHFLARNGNLAALTALTREVMGVQASQARRAVALALVADLFGFRVLAATLFLRTSIALGLIDHLDLADDAGSIAQLILFRIGRQDLLDEYPPTKGDRTFVTLVRQMLTCYFSYLPEAEREEKLFHRLLVEAFEDGEPPEDVEAAEVEAVRQRGRSLLKAYQRPWTIPEDSAAATEEGVIEQLRLLRVVLREPTKYS